MNRTSIAGQQFSEKKLKELEAGIASRMNSGNYGATILQRTNFSCFVKTEKIKIDGRI